MQPLILFGTRPRETDLGKGEFYCPACSVAREDKRVYKRKQVRNYFTLYFVPIIPLGDADEYVICQHCGVAHPPDVLEREFIPKRRILPLAQQLNTLRERLEDGLPVEYAVADLTAAGLARDMAQDNVRQAIGTARRACPTCGLTYAPAVPRCAEDDTPLTDVN